MHPKRLLVTVKFCAEELFGLHMEVLFRARRMEIVKGIPCAYPLDYFNVRVDMEFHSTQTSDLKWT